MVQNTVKPEDSFSGNQLRTVISEIAAAHSSSVSLNDFKPRDRPIDISEKYQSAYGNKLTLLERRRQTDAIVMFSSTLALILRGLVSWTHILCRYCSI
jgi:hypothetical protein